jgi:hypothetical protein
MGVKQRKRNQNGRLKKTEIINSPNSHLLSRKFQELVLGLVELIDAKGSTNMVVKLFNLSSTTA